MLACGFEICSYCSSGSKVALRLYLREILAVYSISFPLPYAMLTISRDCLQTCGISSQARSRYEEKKSLRNNAIILEWAHHSGSHWEQHYFSKVNVCHPGLLCLAATSLPCGHFSCLVSKRVRVFCPQEHCSPWILTKSSLHL